MSISNYLATNTPLVVTFAVGVQALVQMPMAVACQGVDLLHGQRAQVNAAACSQLQAAQAATLLLSFRLCPCPLLTGPRSEAGSTLRGGC